MSLRVRRAVLIGITATSGDYDPLPGAEHDVRAMERVLESHRDGTENFQVRPFIDDEASSEGVGEYLRAIDLELEDADDFVFYFSGHGEVNEFGLQLITPGKDHALDSGIYFDVLLHRFNAASSGKEITVILDCCFSGAAGNLSGGEVLRRFTHLRDGITILASSESDRPSWGSASELSDFTREVVASLEAEQARTDILDVYKWAKEKVPGQSPVLRTFGSRHFALRADNNKTAELEEVSR